MSIPTIPFYLKDLGIPEGPELAWWNGMCQTLPMISMAIVSPMWGVVADRFGKRPMLLRAMIGGAITVGLMTWAWSPTVLTGLRCIQGALTGTVAAANVLTITIVPAEKLAWSMGMLQMGIFTGNALGPFIGGLVADLLGRRAVFPCSALMLGASALLILRYVPRDKVLPPLPEPVSEVEETAEGLAVSRPKSFLENVSLLIHQTTGIWGVLAIGVLFQVANGIVTPILPLFVMQLGRGSAFVASTTGIILGAGSLAAALASVIIGRYALRLGYGRTLAFCLVGAAVFSIPQGFVTSPWQLLVLRLFASLCFGGILPLVPSMLAMRSDRHRHGLVYGLNTSLSSAGQATGPMLGILAVNLWGFPGAFLLTAVIFGLTGFGIFIAIAYRRHRRSSY